MRGPSLEPQARTIDKVRLAVHLIDLGIKPHAAADVLGMPNQHVYRLVGRWGDWARSGRLAPAMSDRLSIKVKLHDAEKRTNKALALLTEGEWDQAADNAKQAADALIEAITAMRLLKPPKVRK